jgi:hypothetical protein
MFGTLLQMMRARAGTKTLVAGIAAAALVALAGGWAFAGHGPGHLTASVKSAAFRSAGSAGRDVSGNSSQAAGPQAGTPQTTQPQGSIAQAGTKMPAGLLLASPQGLAGLSLKGNADTSAHSATGGGSTQFFHFGFTAQPHRSGNIAGSVTGNAEVAFRANVGLGHGHIDVNCLEVVGNDAYMSGVLTNSAFGLAQGTEMLFGVQDDDSASKVDLISDIFFSPAPPFTCHTFHAKPHYAVQGNIEIH